MRWFYLGCTPTKYCNKLNKIFQIEMNGVTYRRRMIMTSSNAWLWHHQTTFSIGLNKSQSWKNADKTKELLKNYWCILRDYCRHHLQDDISKYVLKRLELAAIYVDMVEILKTIKKLRELLRIVHTCFRFHRLHARKHMKLFKLADIGIGKFYWIFSGNTSFLVTK